ncbi:hypothetical protein QOT17_020358 [Balamuthia mandrillaris]
MSCSTRRTKVVVCGSDSNAHVLMVEIGKREAEVELNVLVATEEEAKCIQRGLQQNKNVEMYYRGQVSYGRPSVVSSDAKAVIPGADVVLITGLASKRQAVLTAIAPFLKEGAILAAIPGQGAFNLRALSLLGPSTSHDKIIVGFSYLPFQSVLLEMGTRVELKGYKREVGVAAVPSLKSDAIATLFSNLLSFISVKSLGSYLNVALHPANQVIHPCIMYGLFRQFRGTTTHKSSNKYKMKAKEDEEELELGSEMSEDESFEEKNEDDVTKKGYPQPLLFFQNVDEFTADVLTAVSDEVQGIKYTLEDRLSLNLHAVPTLENMMREMYKDEIQDNSTLLSIFRTNRGYDGLYAPMVFRDGAYFPDFTHEYMTEDVPALLKCWTYPHPKWTLLLNGYDGFSILPSL